MRIFFILILVSLNIQAQTLLNCQGRKLCFQSIAKDQANFIDPIKYERPKANAAKLLQEVLNTLGFKVLKMDENHIKALKKSSFLKVKTEVEFDLSVNHIINLMASSDSPKLDWGDTESLVEKIKFRFYQNNM